jgi:hypothetical protein
MTPQARQYLERKLSYVPETGNVLEDYRRRRDRLNREMDSIGVPNEDEDTRYEVTMSLLGPEPIQEGGFLSERVPAAAGRGADKFGMNVGAMAEYFGRSLGSEGLEGFGQDMAARNRQLLERSPAPYASPEEQERQGYLGRVDDLLLQAGEETIGSAPAIVPPLIGAATGGVPGAVGGFAGVLAANAALEGGSTYSDRKQYYMRQGMPEDQAAKQAKKEADEVAIANLTDPELVALAGVQGASGAIAKGLLPNAGRAARYGTIGGLQAGSGALQEGRQYEVSETATGNPMEQFTGRFSTPEARNSMLVGLISEAVPTVAEGALAAADSRVDPVATDLRRRTQDAAYNAVSANDALEAQRQETLAAAQQQAALEEAERIQKSQAEEQARQRKEQVQREKDALQLMKLEAQAIRERFKTTNEMARAKNEATPAASSGTSTTATSERTAPTADTQRKQIADDKLPGEREAEAFRIPKSGLWQDGEEITDPTFRFGRQKQPGEDVDFTMKEGGFDSRLPTAPERPAPEPDPQPEFTMRDSAIEMPAGPMDQPVEPTAPTPSQIGQQEQYNYPVPTETSASTTEEGPAFQSPLEQETVAPETPVLPAINKEGKTNNGRVTDDTAGAIPKNIFAPPEAPTLVNRRDQPDLEPDAPFDENARPSGGTEEEIITNPQRVREKFEEIGYQDQKPVLDDGIDGLIQSRYSQALPNVFVFEGLTSWSAGHFNGGVGISGRSEFDSDKSRIGYLLAHEFGHASHSLLGDKINANSAVRNELKAIEEFLYPGLRQRVQEADTEGRNIDKQFFNYLLSAEELIAEINPYRLANPEQVQQIAPALSKLLASVEQAPNLVVPRKVFPRGIFYSKAQAIGKLDENLKLKADRQASVGQIYDQDNAAFEIARLLEGNLKKDYGYLPGDIPFEALQSGESQIDLTSPEGKIELATIYSNLGYSRDRQKLERAAQLMDEAFQTDPTKAELASNKSLKEKIDERLAELNQTEPVVEETAPLPERLPEETSSNLSSEFQAILDLERQQEEMGIEAEQAGAKHKALVEKGKKNGKFNKDNLTPEENAERKRLYDLRVAFNKLDNQVGEAYKPYQAEVDRLEQEVGNAVEALPLADRQRFNGLFRKEVNRQALNPDDEISQLRLAQQLLQQLREGGLATREEIANAKLETETVDTASLEEFASIYDEESGPSVEDLAALEAEGLSETAETDTQSELARLIADQGSDIEQDRGAAALRESGGTNEVGFDEGGLYDPNAQEFNIRDEEYTIDGNPRGLRFSYSATSRPTNAAGPSTKLTARQVKAAMEGVKSVLKKLDPNGDRVTVVANKAEAVAKLQEMGRDRDAAGLANREDSLEEGFTLTDTGNIVLIADQIQGKNLREAVDRMVEVTFHEALGHAGLRGLMGEKFNDFIKNFGIKNGKKVDAWLKTKDAQPYVNKDRNTQIEEYIAKNFAETGARDVGFLENLVQNVLSSLGLRQYSETALKKIMQQVQQEFVDGNGNIIEGAQRGTRDVEEEEGAEQTAEEKERFKTENLKEPPARISKKDYNSIVQRVLDDNKDLKPRLYDVEKAVKDVLRNVPSDRRATYLKEQTTDFVVGSGNKAKAKPEEYREIPIESGVSPREALVGRINQELRDRIEYGSARVRYSSRPTSNLIGGQVPLSNWTTPTESKIDDYLYTMQDKMIDTKRVVESIKEAVGNIDERWNPYLQEELYHGRTAKETKDFLTNELQPLMEDLQRFGVSIKDFDNYLWNRHAEERNIQMAKVNPDMPDKGSGRTTAEARDYLANLSPQKRRVFEQLAQRVDNITSQTRQILKDSSLESAETVDTWEDVYKKYVPLLREEFDFQPMQPGAGIGQGYDVRNPASRRAVGSERGVIDVLANVALQRERAITRSNKNKVAQAVYGLAAQNPNTDFWLVIDPAGQKDVRQLAQTLKNMGLPSDMAENFAKEPVTSSTDTRTGLKVSRINASIRNSDNYLSTRINGQDKFVIFNAKNPSSQRMVRSLKNLDADQLGRVMGILGNVTRWMTSVNTQYNPIFGVVNLIRDVQGALINLTSTPIGNKQRQVFAGTPLALKGIYAVLRKDTNRQNQYSQLWEEFQQEGGQTGYKDMFARSDERATALEKELKGLSAGKPMKTLNAIRDWLSDYNEAMENAVRLSAYKVAKEEGMSKQAAASLAKNLTVNFNRKGQIATQAGALYSFFNAAVQGTARMYETMKGPAGAKILKGGLLLGTAQALLLEAADFDEDEPPYFVREKNIILPLVGGGYLTIPMPLGLHIIPNTSRILTEFVLSGGRDTAKRVGQFTGSFLDAFNPIGNAGWSVQTIAPTVADPLVALSENRDWTGSPIAKEDMVSTRPTPGYTRAKDTASTLNTYLAYFLNAASGGTDYQKGLFSPTPDQLDYLVGQAFGGVGRELLKAEQTLSSAVTGEELPPYKIPLAGRFYGNTESSAATSNRFYTNITRLNEHEAEVNGRRANRENVAEYLREFPEARLAGFAGQVETAVRKLQKRKREMLKKNASRSSIEAIEKLITRRMQTLNDRVERFAQTAD